MESRSVIIRSVWAICLLIGGGNHAYILFQHGLFWDYDGAHPASAIYWTLLTVVDPLVAALLFLKPRFGITLTIVLIVTNVIHNLATIAHNVRDGEFLERASHSIILSQIGFMVFVLITAPIARQGLIKVHSGRDA